MASEFHSRRLVGAFLQAANIPYSRKRRLALIKLSERLDAMVLRAVKRDDEKVKAGKLNDALLPRYDLAHTHSRMLAQNNLVIGDMVDFAQRAAELAGITCQSLNL